MPRTALIVVVPEAEPLVQDWRMQYDNASLGVPAHVTLLFPFVTTEDVDERLATGLRDLFASHSRFTYSLPRVARFPEVAWLAPEPDEPFRKLTESIFARYPDYPPYEGIHDELIPHLTVALADEALQDEIEQTLTPELPIAAEAREVTLLLEDASGHWQPGKRFPLGR